MALDLGIIVTGYDKATKVFKDIGAAMQDMGNKAERTGFQAQAAANGLKAIEVVIGGIIIAKSTELTKKFVEMSATVQDVDIHMSAWAGGMSNADKIMDEFIDKVGAAGIDMDVLSQSFVKLRAAGVGVDDAKKTILNMVDGIAAVGGKNLAGKLEGAATAFQRFAAKATVSTRELNAIIGAVGLTVPDLASKVGKGGVSLTRFYEILTDKTLGAQQLIDAFQAAATEKFGGFAYLLKNTVHGAMSQFSADIDEAFGNLGNKGVNNQLVAIIQNLDKAVVGFINNIKSEDITAFFDHLERLGPTIDRLVKLTLQFGKAFLTISEIGLSILDNVPDTMAEYGIIGYLVLGKKGLLIFGIIGFAEEKIRGLMKAAVNALAYVGIGTEFFEKNANKFDRSVLDTMMAYVNSGAAREGSPSKTGSFLSGLRGTKAQLAEIEAANKKLRETKVAPGELSEPPDNLGIMKANAALLQQLMNTVNSNAGRARLLDAKTAGDQLAQTIASIEEQTQGWVNTLETARVSINTSDLSKEDMAGWNAIIDITEKAIAQSAGRAVEHAKVLNKMKREQLSLEVLIDNLQAKEEARQLRREIGKLNDGGAAFMSGTSGAQLMEHVEQKRAQLVQRTFAYELQIKQLREKQRTNTGEAATYERQINGIKEVKRLTEEYSETLTAAGEAQSIFLQDLAASLEGTISDGISGLIKGTMTWGDVGRQVFSDLIDMSVKYLMQLLLIQAVKASIPGGSLLGSLFGFADGGVPGIKMFASGGVPSLGDMSSSILTGPTMFGVAGEAGTEAIMPLARVGGKLGVRAEGGGGSNHYHISVSAIDTQTGMEFIGRHIEDIDARLAHNRRLNHAVKH